MNVLHLNGDLSIVQSHEWTFIEKDKVGLIQNESFKIKDNWRGIVVIRFDNPETKSF